jgi:hypothetical protein
MKYDESWNISVSSTYAQARVEGWGDDWLAAAEFVRIADYDYQHGIIDSITEYDE